jgi:hypothetical protein
MVEDFADLSGEVGGANGLEERLAVVDHAATAQVVQEWPT